MNWLDLVIGGVGFVLSVIFVVWYFTRKGF